MTNFVLVVVGIIGLLMFFQLIMKYKSWSRRGKTAPKVGGALGRSILKGEKTIAYFYSPTCRACKTQEKQLPSVQDKVNNIFRINAAKERETATAFGVMGTPTTVVIEAGIIKDYFVGITPAGKMLKALGLS
jgi:thiol-disulfide isomerase/thioredoxin